MNDSDLNNEITPHLMLLKALNNSSKNNTFFCEGKKVVEEYLDALDKEKLNFEYEQSYEYNYPIYSNPKGEIFIPFNEINIKYTSFEAYDLSTFFYGGNGMGFLWGRSKILKDNLFDNYETLSKDFFGKIGLTFSELGNILVLDNFIENLPIEEKYKFLNVYISECIGVLLFDLSKKGWEINIEINESDGITWEPYLLWSGNKVVFVKAFFEKVFDDKEVKNILLTTFESQLLIASNLKG